jgi:hypothetical protein
MSSAAVAGKVPTHQKRERKSPTRSKNFLPFFGDIAPVIN